MSKIGINLKVYADSIIQAFFDITEGLNDSITSVYAGTAHFKAISSDPRFITTPRSDSFRSLPEVGMFSNFAVYFREDQDPHVSVILTSYGSWIEVHTLPPVPITRFPIQTVPR